MAKQVPLPSALSSGKIARRAIGEYGFRDITVRQVRDTFNAIYRVTARAPRKRTAQQFTLRVHLPNWHDQTTIASELMWLEAIGKERSLAAPRPVRNRHGELVTAVETDQACRYCSLTHWVEGRKVWKRPSPAWLKKIGALMAALQRHGRSFRRPRGFRRPRWDAEMLVGRRGILAEGWPQLPKREAKVLGDVAERFLDTARAVGKGRRSFGLIHADLHVANVLRAGGQPVAIDFDDCGDGYYLSDVAAALDFLEFRDNYAPLREAFLTGYCDASPLPDGHHQHINAFLSARWLTIVLFFARRPQDQRIARNVLKIVIPKLKRFLRDPSALG